MHFSARGTINLYSILFYSGESSSSSSRAYFSLQAPSSRQCQWNISICCDNQVNLIMKISSRTPVYHWLPTWRCLSTTTIRPPSPASARLLILSTTQATKCSWARNLWRQWGAIIWAQEFQREDEMETQTTWCPLAIVLSCRPQHLPKTWALWSLPPLTLSTWSSSPTRDWWPLAPCPMPTRPLSTATRLPTNRRDLLMVLSKHLPTFISRTSWLETATCHQRRPQHRRCRLTSKGTWFRVKKCLCTPTLGRTTPVPWPTLESLWPTAATTTVVPELLLLRISEGWTPLRPSQKDLSHQGTPALHPPSLQLTWRHRSASKPNARSCATVSLRQSVESGSWRGSLGWRTRWRCWRARTPSWPPPQPCCGSRSLIWSRRSWVMSPTAARLLSGWRPGPSLEKEMQEARTTAEERDKHHEDHQTTV